MNTIISRVTFISGDSSGNIEKRVFSLPGHKGYERNRGIFTPYI